MLTLAISFLRSAKGPAPGSAGDRLLYVLFFCSGACALLYEHLFHKLLGRTLGTSAAGAAAVLAAYMGGLGLGSLAGGRLARRTRRPWRTYAAIEAAVALCALTVPRLLGGVTALYVALAAGRAGALLQATRFLIAALVTVAPAVLAGMTFPLGARILESHPAATGRRLGALYGWNTLGAALGVLASTYFLVPSLGTSRTLTFGAAINLLIAAIATTIALREREREREPEPEPEPAPSPPSLPLFTTLFASALSGFLALALEVVWFRLLAVVIGASVFAFGLMLFSFLVGNGLGGTLSSRGRLGRAGPGALVALQLAAAAVILLSLPLWDRIPSVFVVTGRLEPGFALAELVRLVCALTLLVPPTLLLGAAFPLLFRLGRRAASGDAASSVARVYALDTLGAVAGALGASFLFLPLLGARTALIGLALLSGVLALVYLRATPLPAPRRRLAYGALAALPLVALAMPSWDFARLNAGSNAYFAEGFRDYDRLLFAAEDAATGLVTVVEKAGTRTLLTNGKFEGNDSFEVRDQYLFSLLPLLFVHHFDTAMNIGVGTGATLRVMNTFPFRTLEAVDLSSAVIRAARDWFGKINGGALDDPRVEVIVEDGRNRLLSTRRRYDLISIELSSIWMSGTGELYNREFYQLARDRLAEGGVFQQWLQLHHISRRDLTTVIYTLRTVFPHVTLWVSGHQGVLIASAKPLAADPSAIAGWSAATNELVRASGLFHPLSALGHLYLETEDVDRLAADVAAAEELPLDALVSSDERPRLEYSTPRGNLLPRAFADNLQLVERYAMTRLQPLIAPTDAATADLVAAYAAWERGYRELARDHALRAGAALDAPPHQPLRHALGLP
jgi:spermidine synthase